MNDPLPKLKMRDALREVVIKHLAMNSWRELSVEEHERFPSASIFFDQAGCKFVEMNGEDLIKSILARMGDLISAEGK